MTDPNRLIDNRNGNTVALSLKSALQPQDQIDLVSAYFSVNGYRQLADQLEQAGQVRFLYGEPNSVNNPDPARNDAQSFKLVESVLKPSRVMEQKEAARRCAEWLEKPEVQVKSVKNQRFLHGKMYLVSGRRKPKVGIIGSSNFTARGLGAGDGSGNANLEINLATDQPQVLGQMQEWFNELWNDPSHTCDVKAEVLAALARIQREQSPELIYYKTLYELFRKQLAEREATQQRMQTVGFDQTKIWKTLYGFQRDGVNALLTKLDKHNGCILADGVGLGKTYTALGVIKYHELRNERVLVLCPKRLNLNWSRYQAKYDAASNPLAQDQLRYTLLNHSDLRRKAGLIDGVPAQKFNFSNYDLVVIDESHNFRNHGAAYNKLLDEVIKKGGNTKVLLLSATPVNNALTDLQNQIDLMTQDRQDAFNNALDIPSVRELLQEEQSKFKEWQKEPPDSRQKLPELLSPELVNLLEAISIARSRQHIKDSYAADLKEFGAFPKRAKPDDRTPELSIPGRNAVKADYAQIAETICQMTLAVYRPAHYLIKPSQPPPTKGGQSQLAGMGHDERQQRTEIYLTGIQKTIFLKRLESSIHAFDQTLSKAIAKMSRLINKIERFERQGRRAGAVLPESDYLLEPDTLEEEQELLGFADLENALEQQFQSGKRTHDLSAMDTKRWQEDLKKDRELLQGIKTLTAAITQERDGKLADLKKVIRSQARKDGAARKLLVFTTYKDTAEYLYASLEKLCGQLKMNLAMVSGSDNKSPQQGNIPVRKSYEDILDRFAPKARTGNDRQQKEAGIDLLIATDCISEGQNLQDCNTVVNYDIHWNPVRLIQRFGRVDRIGSQHQEVRMVNYWPTKSLATYLDLQSRVMTKGQLVNFVGGEKADALTAGQDFRARQLKKMQTEIPEMEELSEGPNLNEISLDQYLDELLRFLQNRRKELEAVPNGSYAVVDNSKLGAHQPGAIFLFREKSGDNPEQSEGKCRLVYAADSRRPGSHHETIHAFREAAAGIAKPNNELCDRFNRETEQGKDMSAYDRLLQSALAAGADNALMERQDAGGATAETAAAPEYELVTWLAILDRNPAAPAGGKPRRKDDAVPAAAPPAELPWNWMATLPPALAVKLTTHRHGDVPNLSVQQLYDAARKHWPVSQAAREQAKYVLAVHQDKVVAVYEPGRWRRVANESKIYSFTGKLAPASIRKQYVGQDCPIARNRRVRDINMA